MSNYTPTPVPQSAAELPGYLVRELNQLAQAWQEASQYLALTPIYAAPKKLRNGMLVLADGISWNPGAGAGVYSYVNGAWVAGFAPASGWRDIVGAVAPKASGVGFPARAAWNGTIADYSFILNDVCDFCFHIPHDYVPGTDLSLHVHWSHNGTAITGNATFTLYHTYASRTVAGTTVFPAEKTNTINWATTNIATTPKLAHRMDEIAITSAAGSASLTANTLIEVDGLVLATLKLTSLPTITGGKLFVHSVDLHYKSNNAGTKNSAPNYYI
jgi:hypothetical protein